MGSDDPPILPGFNYMATCSYHEKDTE